LNFARLCQIYSEYEKYAKLSQKLFWQNRPQNFLPKASKFCQIFKIWQKLCQIGNASLTILVIVFVSFYFGQVNFIILGVRNYPGQLPLVFD